MAKTEKLLIIRDTREQAGYDFACIAPPPAVEVRTLHTGDYSLAGAEDLITIERKSLIDAYGTFGQGRNRFEKELERMRSFQFAAVVIEANWHTILCRPPARTRLAPKTIHASVIAWQQRFGVHFWTCDSRELAERTTYRLLERFWRDQEKARRQA